MNLSSPWIKIAIHLTIAIVAGTLITLFLFQFHLPNKTNHGESITVPDVVGIHYDDLDQYLLKRNLRFEINEDSSYSADFKPLEVLKQFPLPDSKVKEGRKIYLTLNTKRAPKVKMPDLESKSLKSAQLILQNADLKIGEITYKPARFFNTVLGLTLNGKAIAPGEEIPKGSVVDLILADGLGNRSLESPNLLNLDQESALIAIVGSGLRVGRVTYDNVGTYVVVETNEDGEEELLNKQADPGAVYKQTPEPGTEMRLSQFVNIWVYQPDSVSSQS